MADESRRLDISIIVNAEGHNPYPLCRLVLHSSGIRIVVIQNHRAPGRNSLYQLPLGLGNIFNGAQKLNMGFPHVGHNADLRGRKRCQGCNLPQAPHADFHHSRPVHIVQLQQGIRHADFVVEVALGFQHGKTGRQHRCRHVLGSGLAVGAGNGNHRNVKLPAPESRQLLIGQLGIGHSLDKGCPELSRLLLVPASHQHTGCPLLYRLGSKILAVEPLPLQCHEQRPRHNLPGIRHNIGKLRLYLLKDCTPLQGMYHIIQRKCWHKISYSPLLPFFSCAARIASRATSLSSK